MPETGGVSLNERNNALAKHYGLEWGPLSVRESPSPVLDGLPRAPLPLAQIKPGESLIKKLHSYDTDLAEAGMSAYVLALGGSAPTWAGEFRVGYWSAHVDFRVVMPVFEGMARVELPEWEENQVGPERLPARVQRRVYAFILGEGGKHFVCLEKAPFSTSAPRPELDVEGKVRDNGLPFAFYSRIAESETPLAALRGEADANGNITLTWGKNGESRKLLLRDEWRIELGSKR